MTQPNGHILVVDDDREMNEMVGAYAQLAGYDYRSALDGGTAVRMATARVPALVLLDVMLPDLDGFDNRPSPHPLSLDGREGRENSWHYPYRPPVFFSERGRNPPLVPSGREVGNKKAIRSVGVQPA